MEKPYDSVQMRQLKDEFYEVLGRHNATVYGLLSQLYARIAHLRSLTLSQPNRLPDTVRELEELVSAISSGSMEEVEESARGHVESARTIALRVAARKSSEEAGSPAAGNG